MLLEIGKSLSITKLSLCCLRLLVSFLLVDLVVSQHLLLSWLTPRWAGPGPGPGVRSSSRCPGRCENLLVCGLTGGHLVEQGQCSGLLSVCCLHPRSTRAPRLTRVPRQLSLQPSLSSLPRQARLATLNPPETPRFSYDVGPAGRRKPSASKYAEPELSPETENLVAGGWRTCGQSRQVAQSRILGGADAGYGQFPWTALIQIYSKKHGLDKMCAGSLVQDRSVHFYQGL